MAAVLPYIQLEPFCCGDCDAPFAAAVRPACWPCRPLPTPRTGSAGSDRAQRLQAKVVEWRRDFHQHPELSNREARTSAEVAKRLRAMGLTPKTGIAHHGVVAIIEGGKPGPKIALRADMDALPVTEQTGLPFASRPLTSTAGRPWA